ncbi:MAG: thermonuclease family protein [Paracoccus sp. (in: a-proteobacteria)]|nr:thermonuclease family protein [Paracoccus sp. (in: a-proteobacteria)]
MAVRPDNGRFAARSSAAIGRASARIRTAALVTAIILSAPDVTDGDTLRAGGTHYRLWGVDAPERRQPGGVDAARVLVQIISGQRLTCEHMHTDRYGWPVVRCVRPNGADIACEMVATGRASDWPRYSSGYCSKCDRR